MSGSSLVQLELTIDTPPFVGPDQALMAVVDRVQRTIEGRSPEVKEPVHLGKIGSQIVVLPDVGLENGFKVRDAIKDMRGGQAVAAQLPFQIR